VRCYYRDSALLEEDQLVKTIIVLASHGAPATDCPRGKIGMFMALESMPRLVKRFKFLQRVKASLDQLIRNWPRTPENDPYREGVLVLAERIAAQTGTEVISGYLEFCAPDIGACIDEAVARGAGRVVVVTTMTTRGGEHSETEIREIVEAAQICHPGVQVMYAWPFDIDRVARMFADEIERFVP
jgi:sirohydrochlorin cobaltochelatase